MSAAPVRRIARIVARPTLWLPLLSLLVFLAVWEAVGRSVDPLLFAPPSRMAGELPELLSSGELAAATGVTLQALVVGYLLAAVSGVLLGIAIGQWDTLGRLLGPYLFGLFSTPRVVLVPLVILWFGIGYGGRLFLVFLWSMIAIATTTADGIRNARPDLVEVARSYGAGRAQTILHVLLPGSIPFVLSGLRIGAERAVVGVVIGEMFLEITGLGGLLQDSAQSLETARMLWAVVVIAVIGTVLITGLDALERRLSSWKAEPT
ncbi:ABC transporter permease [Allonocardiopsis opalescens]|uniref:NitT/TauT family transport system permease protein n=1 Tax=Allonocardiopsis opalescens TaxID=1144618 RepID=A0A2T0QEI6_9ACTN|nr:ABC transporter permease [Allonocardiopsis opalescens]PRY02271.1 NitT/TauT family transport system permease protein [Allonocardiopsis opalescens]